MLHTWCNLNLGPAAPRKIVFVFVFVFAHNEDSFFFSKPNRTEFDLSDPDLKVFFITEAPPIYDAEDERDRSEPEAHGMKSFRVVDVAEEKSVDDEERSDEDRTQGVVVVREGLTRPAFIIRCCLYIVSQSPL